jgi:predicted DNA-binding ribbon-helix-helix protein
VTEAGRSSGPGKSNSGPETLLEGWDASAAEKPQKRSLTISGHRTSISLEAPFWEGLREVARQKNVSVAALVAAIDAVRGNVNLSTATRLFLYSHIARRNEGA